MNAKIISRHGRWIVVADGTGRYGVFKDSTPLATLRLADFRRGFFVLEHAQMYARGAVA